MGAAFTSRTIRVLSFFFSFFFFLPISLAHACDGLQLPTGAEAEFVSVGAEGSRRVGADPGGAECAVSLPAGYFPAAILTCHSSLRLHVSTTDKQTGGSSGATVDHLR